jgi:hypothetical protein
MNARAAMWGAALALSCSGLVLAQTVYESTGAGGRVYSDRPLPGGKPVDLKPINVIEAPPVRPPSAVPTPAGAGVEPAESAESAAVRYRNFAVVFPESGGSVVANNAVFEVRVSVDPPLQIARGHAFALRLDGRNVPGRYTATEMIVPPEFFRDMVLSGGQPHVVEVEIVDATGGVVLAAPPVSFHSRFVNVVRQPAVVPKPRAVPKPAPLPVDERKAEKPAPEVMRLK